MNKSSLLKILVPIVAIVIVVESLVLITNLNKKRVNDVVDKTQTSGSGMVADDKNLPTSFEIQVVGEPSMKVGQTQKIEVTASALMNKSVDSINVYLKYNPAVFDLTNLTFDKRLPTPTFSKVSTSTGLVVVNFLISDPEGVKLMSGDKVTLMSFDAKPKATGKFDFEINTGNESKESATMIVENTTSEILPFSSNKLTVEVAR